MTLFTMRTGRRLEVWEYGDPAGHPVFFFHGLIGSHHQASYIAHAARAHGLRILAPNRPGVGKSGFVPRRTALETVSDVEDLAAALGLDDFSLIGISGGTPYVLAALHTLRARVRTATVISGMGPLGIRGALRGVDPGRRLFLELGARWPRIGKRGFERLAERYHRNPSRFLDRMIGSWSVPDQKLFARRAIYDLFMKDLQQVFDDGVPAESLSQQLVLFGNYGFRLKDLPVETCVTLWQGLADNIVPPTMAWELTRRLPNCESHFVPGGHFMAIDNAERMVSRLTQLLALRPTHQET